MKPDRRKKRNGRFEYGRKKGYIFALLDKYSLLIQKQ